MTDSLDHSGVAGERSDSRIDSETGPTRVPVPDPVDPSAALTTGCVVVPDEAVEAGVRAALEYWAQYGIEVAQTLLVRREIEAALPAAAPLIVEAALRARQVEPTPEVAWEQMRVLSRDALARTAAVDALRAVARDLGDPLCAPCATIVDQHADRIERGPKTETMERGGDQ